MKTEIIWIDIVKAIGIILVVIGHYIEPYRSLNYVYNGIYILIYTFHMPLFCFASGFLAKYKKSTIFNFMVFNWTSNLFTISCLAGCKQYNNKTIS